MHRTVIDRWSNLTKGLHEWADTRCRRVTRQLSNVRRTSWSSSYLSTSGASAAISSIVEAHSYRPLPGGHVGHRVVTRAADGEPTAVDPHQHGTSHGRHGSGGIDIGVEAVLALLVAVHHGNDPRTRGRQVGGIEGRGPVAAVAVPATDGARPARRQTGSRGMPYPGPPKNRGLREMRGVGSDDGGSRGGRGRVAVVALPLAADDRRPPVRLPTRPA